MKAKLKELSGQAAVVTYRDNVTGMTEAKVISIRDLPQGLRRGQEFDIPEYALESGTEYGIDWGIVLGQFDVVSVLTSSMRDHGIWMPEDLQRKPQQVIAAINATSKVVYAELLRLSKEI